MTSFEISGVETKVFASPVNMCCDPQGHIGKKDSFFFVVAGECYVNIENRCFVVKEGELIFLPKGKMRTYSTFNENLLMYAFDFQYTIDGTPWTEKLGLCDGFNHISVKDASFVAELFEESAVKKDGVNEDMYNCILQSNLSTVIKQYVSGRIALMEKEQPFTEVLAFIENNLCGGVTVGDMAAIVGMESSYFIKKFKAAMGETPLNYYNKVRMYKAMTLLASTDLPIEKVSSCVGISDSSYFAKLFKKYCFINPAEYRILFKKFTNEYMF